MVTREVKREENIVSESNVKEGTDTSDVSQPFPTSLTRPVTLDTNGTYTADSEENENLSLQTFLPQEQLSMLNQTAVAPQIKTPTQATAQAAVTTPVQTPIFVSNKNHMQIGEFEKNIAKYQQYANRKTGFPNLDAIHSFRPGLYLILAETSVGKTAFALQWCDQIAIQGEYVLYFAFGQSRSFLMSKSISRQCFLRRREDEMKNGTSNLPIYTSSDIRNEDADGIEMDKQTYDNIQKIDDRMFVVSTNFNGDINSICKCIEDFIQQTGHKPVVIIDYVHLVPSAVTSNGMVFDSKANIDQGIHQLKLFQDENDLTVLTISSVSRMGYSEEIALSHVKGSGAMLYTCDFMIGIQLRARHDYYKEQNQTKKMTEIEREAHIARAKAAFPRKVEAVYLKDCYGGVGRAAYFDYYPKYETFVATDINGNPLA